MVNGRERRVRETKARKLSGNKILNMSVNILQNILYIATMEEHYVKDIKSNLLT